MQCIWSCASCSMLGKTFEMQFTAFSSFFGRLADLVYTKRVIPFRQRLAYVNHHSLRIYGYGSTGYLRICLVLMCILHSEITETAAPASRWRSFTVNQLPVPKLHVFRLNFVPRRSFASFNHCGGWELCDRCVFAFFRGAKL